MLRTPDAIDKLLARMATEVTQRLSQVTTPIHLVGIHTGGVWVADALNRHLASSLPLHTLAPRFYRDDLHARGMKLDTRRSELPGNIDGATILLVDDVLMSGRTIRAALNELFDYGRPARVLLVILFDVGQRELPIQGDICGEHLSIRPGERVELHGPAPLCAELVTPGKPLP